MIEKINKWVPSATLVVLAILILVLVGGHNQSANLGSETGTRFPSGVSIGTSVSPNYKSLLVGANGTSIANISAGQCYLRPYAATIVASSTVKVDCQGTALWDVTTPNTSALTGVQNGDNIQIELSTTTAGTVSNGLVVTGASGSTTPGYIELTISNLTGGTYTWPITTGIASGTASYIDTR